MAEERKRINLSPSPALQRYINQLIATGLYGGDETTVATRFVEEGIRRALERGIIHRETG